MASWISRVKAIVKWGVTSDARNDSGSVPIQQHMHMGKASNAAVWRQYGFDANVPPGNLAILLAVLANPDARVALQGFMGRAPELASGEVTVFHPETGSKIHFRHDGTIEVLAGEALITITPSSGIDVTPAEGMPVTVNGDLVVTGTLDVAGALTATTSAAVGTTLAVTGATTLGAVVTSNSKDISDTHTHEGSPFAPSGAQSDTGTPN